MIDSLPTWQELPTIELYLDQVLLYVNEKTSLSDFLQVKPLTAAMINNYVKHGYITKPIKKKYGKQQLAQLIAITLFKEVFAIADVTRAIAHLRKQSEAAIIYDAFVTSFKEETQRHIKSIATCERVLLADEKEGMAPMKKNEIPPVVQLACQTLVYYYHTYEQMQRMEGKDNDTI